MSTFKCAICVTTFNTRRDADEFEEEVEMQTKWGQSYDLDDCEPICPKCFALFFGDDDE